MTREVPILFSAPMIRAILDGRKTQTRRAVNLSRAVGEPDVPPGHVLDLIYPRSVQHYGYVTPAGHRTTWRVQRLCDAACKHGDDVGPYDGRHLKSWGPMPYAPGDRLWVRETHAQFAVGEGRDRGVPQCVAYRATCDADGGFDYVNGRGEVMRLKITKWTPAIHMPRWASRITLEVAEVRLQRLQEIGAPDACDEGALEVLDRGHPMRSECYEKHGTWTGDERLDVDGPFAGAIAAFATLWDSINGERAPWSSNPWVWALSFRRLP